MEQWTDSHFCRFLTVLEYFLISGKFTLTIEVHTLYTVKKKKLIVFKVLMYSSNFDVQQCF
jgi:hypothetical protein